MHLRCRLWEEVLLIRSRYTLTYTPSLDRILPPPSHLYVKVRNTSAIPLRAAYLHGPYTLYAACYPSTFDPNSEDDCSWEDGAPEFEPNLKAAGSWISHLSVPERVRESVDKAPNNPHNGDSSVSTSFTWIIEISSQVVFSTSAAVHFELLVSRDKKSLELGFTALGSHASAATPGQLEDHQQDKKSRYGAHGAAQPKGVYSHAVKLVVDDTASLWNKPALPQWGDEEKKGGVKPERDGLVNGYAADGKIDVGERSMPESGGESTIPQKRKRKRVHLVVLTHGLHSNLGSDMLYLKESIDATAKKARESARKRRQQAQKQGLQTRNKSNDVSNERDASTRSAKPSEHKLVDHDESTEDDDEEEVIVRGFSGNATRTEKGIQYLGKRLAKWILSMTYPDQPFLPAKKSIRKKLSRVLTSDAQSPSVKNGIPEHKNSSIYKPVEKKVDQHAYKITSISFVAHSLGGLTQTYAIAYIHKHSPNFFDEIKPINFVAMAAPFLGLSNENPLYVKFALDFGLVGRTGQDLGLAWKSSTALRGGWDAMIAGIGNEGQRAQKQPDPGSKPLLRILPTGHTHQVLKLFRNRTVYSNVVNDGIVPLRTSCLLFLDWSGLGRVEKARRENGLVSGLAGWGWAELTGANASSRHLRAEADSDAWSQSNVSIDGTRSRSRSRTRRPSSQHVPQPEENLTKHENTVESFENPKPHQFLNPKNAKFQDEEYDVEKAPETSTHPMSGFLSLFRPTSNKSQQQSPKQTKIYRRSQTVKTDSDGGSNPPSEINSPIGSRRPSNVRGDSILDEPNVVAPPKTTFFESAGDILNPPLPSQEFLINPSTRPRTIFHDRVYHPEDIPPPRAKKPARTIRSTSLGPPSPSSPSLGIIHDGTGSASDQIDTSGMKVEEKIARAYHHGLSWRKVLVRLEPDAHNNLVVRRMFSNAYGWPVIKHLVDTHFADTYEAATADVYEPNAERAKPIDEEFGEEIQPISTKEGIRRTDSEVLEAKDQVPELRAANLDGINCAHNRPEISRKDSFMSAWDDILFEGSDEEDDIDSPASARHHSPPSTVQNRSGDDPAASSSSSPPRGTSDAEIAAFLGRRPPVLLNPAAASSESGQGKLMTSPVGATGLGLRKSIEEQIAAAKGTEVGTTSGNGKELRHEERKSFEEDKEEESGYERSGQVAEAGETEVPDLTALQVENGL